MPRSRLDQSFSLSLLLQLRIGMAAANQSLRQRLSRAWLNLISRHLLPTNFHQDQPMDWELDPDLPPKEIWSEYLEDPTVIDACSHHLDRCYKNPPANHHGH